ncbi:MAG: hypothetical protein AAFV98_14145 [Chloroflexota bacterium]
MTDYDRLILDDSDDLCPICDVGRLRQSQKPLCRVHRGKLFCVPQAKYQFCDVCGYDSYDEIAYDLLGIMLLAAMPAEDAKTRTRPVATVPDPSDVTNDKPSTRGMSQ